ncbi:MAG TPA: hypothetical protein PLW78_07910, partial [bacterium]|nr:hypothetical protein [bacterium]
LELTNTGTGLSKCPETETCDKYVDEIETLKAASLSKSDLLLISFFGRSSIDAVRNHYKLQNR